MKLSVEIPSGLVGELLEASSASGITPRRFVSEVVEAALAVRRLSTVKPAPSGPYRRVELAIDSRPRRAERRARREHITMKPSDIPALDDLDSISDIR